MRNHKDHLLPVVVLHCPLERSLSEGLVLVLLVAEEQDPVQLHSVVYLLEEEPDDVRPHFPRGSHQMGADELLELSSGPVRRNLP